MSQTIADSTGHVSAESQMCNWYGTLIEAKQAAADYFVLDPQVVSVEFLVLTVQKSVKSFFIHRDGRCQDRQFTD